jgi:hypothetical protein
MKRAAQGRRCTAHRVCPAPCPSASRQRRTSRVRRYLVRAPRGPSRRRCRAWRVRLSHADCVGPQSRLSGTRFERLRREPLLSHDLRSTFRTWARRDGKTDACISERTGQEVTGDMINRYDRGAQTLADLAYAPFPTSQTRCPSSWKRVLSCPKRRPKNRRHPLEPSMLCQRFHQLVL